MHMTKTSLLLKLPVELVEEIVLCAAASGDPTAPASLSLTCRTLRASIYAAQTHLWRHLFLTLFDPPPSPHYPWETSYKSRISAQLFFQSRVVDPERPAEPSHVAQVLESVLDVLHSAKPLDSRDLEPDTPSASTHPVFPPLSIILHSSPSRVPPSLNTSFVSRLLAPGLPPLLSARLNAYCIAPETPREAYDGPLARLVAAVGPLQAARAPPPRPFFGPHMPGIVVGADGPENLLKDPEVPEGSGGSEGGGGEERIWRCSRKMVWEPERADGVRRLARIRAYDMAYLHPTRLHAPFLPITPTSTQTSDSQLLVPTRSILSHTLDEIEDASSDSDYSPHASPVLNTSINSSTSTLSSTSSHSHSSPADDQPLQNFPDPPSPPAPPPGVPDFVPPPFAHVYASEPPPHELQFDWTWLSAARTVVQHNLRDLLAPRHAHALRALVALEGLRVGAAPGFVGDDARETVQKTTVTGGGKGKERAVSPALGRIVEDTSFLNEPGQPSQCPSSALAGVSDMSFLDNDPAVTECPSTSSATLASTSAALAEALEPAPIRKDGSCMAMPEPSTATTAAGRVEDWVSMGDKTEGNANLLLDRLIAETSGKEVESAPEVQKADALFERLLKEGQGEADLKEKDKGKGKGKEEVGGGVGAECEGWDWAGVAGQWRRCVCWLDYKDLVAHNTHPFEQRFTDPTLYEVMRIVPMTLRVAKYTRGAHGRRPTIHVAGTVAGAGAQHTVWGKVEEVGGGDIRWSLFTLREDGESAWQSDGVQLGGPGSAAGVLGMWTSAEHEHMDPLGPFWAWKVGAARRFSNVAPAAGLGAADDEPQSVQGKRPSESSRREPER